MVQFDGIGKVPERKPIDVAKFKSIDKGVTSADIAEAMKKLFEADFGKPTKDAILVEEDAPPAPPKIELRELAKKMSLGDMNVKDKDARAKLGEKVASNGISYDDAKATISKIEAKYKEDLGAFDGGKYHKQVQDPSPITSGGNVLDVYRFHYELDPNKIPEPDRTDFLRAQAAVKEIESQNSALVADAYGRYDT